MPCYTFYPNRSDGSALVFEEAELPSDAEAMAYARKVLSQHGSSVLVDIWDGDRDVDTVRRPPAARSAWKDRSGQPEHP
jgi:hypothetical protein